jgi:hypothetical protein
MDDTIIREFETAMKDLELQSFETARYWNDNKQHDFYRFLDTVQHNAYNYLSEFKRTNEEMENYLYKIDHL